MIRSQYQGRGSFTPALVLASRHSVPASDVPTGKIAAQPRMFAASAILTVGPAGLEPATIGLKVQCSTS